MHQIVSPRVDTSRRWWVLAIVVAAQFMFGVDAFIVNVAIPTIAVELHASPAQIESVIAIYLIAYATLVVTGGRLGDIYGTKAVFIGGVLGFSATSLWCGLAQSGGELIAAAALGSVTASSWIPTSKACSGSSTSRAITSCRAASCSRIGRRNRWPPFSSISWGSVGEWCSLSTCRSA